MRQLIRNDEINQICGCLNEKFISINCLRSANDEMVFNNWVEPRSLEVSKLVLIKNETGLDTLDIFKTSILSWLSTLPCLIETSKLFQSINKKLLRPSEENSNWSWNMYVINKMFDLAKDLKFSKFLLC